MYQLLVTSKFKKDLKRIKAKPDQLSLVSEVMQLLQKQGVDGIPARMKPHRLKGEYVDNWECHLKPDLLILWIQIEAPKTIKLVRIGSHSDLFK